MSTNPWGLPQPSSPRHIYTSMPLSLSPLNLPIFSLSSNCHSMLSSNTPALPTRLSRPLLPGFKTPTTSPTTFTSNLLYLLRRTIRTVTWVGICGPSSSTAAFGGGIGGRSGGATTSTLAAFAGYFLYFFGAVGEVAGVVGCHSTLFWEVDG